MADKSPGVVGKSQAVLTTQSTVASHHTSIVSTLILCTNTPPFDSADATLRVNGQGKSQG